MIEELQEEIAEWRRSYVRLGKGLGQIINEQQDTILALRSENKRLKREIWNFRKTKGRRR